MAPAVSKETITCAHCVSPFTLGLYKSSQAKSWAVRSHETCRLICTWLRRKSLTVITTTSLSAWFFRKWSHSLPSATGAAILRRIHGLEALVESAVGQYVGCSRNPRPASSRMTSSGSTGSSTTLFQSSNEAVSLCARYSPRSCCTRQTSSF